MDAQLLWPLQAAEGLDLHNPSLTHLYSFPFWTVVLFCMSLCHRTARTCWYRWSWSGWESSMMEEVSSISSIHAHSEEHSLLAIPRFCICPQILWFSFLSTSPLLESWVMVGFRSGIVVYKFLFLSFSLCITDKSLNLA